MFWKYLYVVELRHFHLKNEFSSKYNKYIIQQNILIYNVNPFLHAKKELFNIIITYDICFHSMIPLPYAFLSY